MITTDFNSVANWVAGKVGSPIPSHGGAAIGYARDGDILCGVMYEHFTGPCITATIVLDKGSVMPREFLRIIFDYPFNQLGCEQMLAYIAEDNWRSRRLVEHMGFHEVARIEGVFPTGAMLVYMMKKGTCRFLGERYGQEN